MIPYFSYPAHSAHRLKDVYKFLGVLKTFTFNKKIHLFRGKIYKIIFIIISHCACSKIAEMEVLFSTFASNQKFG